MASQPGGGQHQHENPSNGPSRTDREEPGGDRPSRRPTLAGDDAAAADILQAWDRARAAQDASLQRNVHTDSGVGPDGGKAGFAHDEEVPGHSNRKHPLPPSSDDLTRGLLGAARCQQSSAQNVRPPLSTADGRGFQANEAPMSEASPRDWVRRAKQRRNSYSVPQSKGTPDILLAQPTASVSQQGTPLPPPSSDEARQSRGPPQRCATLQDLKADPDEENSGGADPAPQTAGAWTGLALLGGGQGGSPSPGSPKPPSISGRDGTPPSSSGQHAAPASGVDSGGGAGEAGIRRKFIKMMSIQRTKQRSTAGIAKPGQQAAQSPDGPEAPAKTAGAETDDEAEPAAPAAAAATVSVTTVAAAAAGQPPPRPVPHDSDDEDVEDVRPSGGPQTAHWGMGGSGPVGPSPSELRMMGAASSVSFKKSTMKQGVLRPLSTLPPFVPRLFIEDITLNHEKYRGFDAAGRDLTAASKTLQPSIIELQAAVMIADVTGFTKLTEILSKKGTSGVELLTTCMNNYFTRAINMIMAFEGDVVKFAGDSMIVLFYPNEHERRHADKGLRACTLRMMACAHQLATKLGHMSMKMNGQVEPALAPPPEPASAAPTPPPAPASTHPSALMSAPLPSALLPGVGGNAMPSMELDGAPEGVPGGGAGASDLSGRNNSGPFSSAAARRVARDSPRSSATNQQLPSSPGGGGGAAGGGLEEASSAATDGMVRGDSDSAAQGSGGGGVPRKRGKSWNLMANILRPRGQNRRAEAYLSPGSQSSQAASSSGPSRASFEKNDLKGAATRMSARERAKTETGLGLTLRGSGPLSGAAAGDGGAAAGATGLWGAGEGVVRREMSVATKLNLPPPVRPRASLNISQLQTAGSGGAAGAAAAAGAGAPLSGPLTSGVYPGSGSALASLANSGLVSATSGSPRSFTEQAAASGGSFRRVPLGSRSERRITGGPALVGAGSASGDWRSKLQNLSTAIVNAPGGGGGGRGEDDPLAPQRSRLSESARAVRWDTVQEEEAMAEDEEGPLEGEHDEEEEDASYPPIQADSQGSGSSGHHAHSLNTRASGLDSGGTEGASAATAAAAALAAAAAAAVAAGSPSGSAGGGGSAPLERMYSPIGNTSGGVGRNAHAVDLRRKLLLRASQSDREDMHRRGGAGSQREDGLATGPGPVAEASGEISGSAAGTIARATSYDATTSSSYDPEPLLADSASSPAGVEIALWAAGAGPDPVAEPGPGPVAEAVEDGGHGRSRVNSDTDGLSSPHGGPPGEAKQGSFMSKVVNWFSANARNRGGSYVDSFSNLGPQSGGGGAAAAAGGGAGDGQSDAQGSQPPSGPVSASNSFNHMTGLAGITRMPPPNLGPGNGPMGKGPRGDPIMEEVSNSRLSLKVMTSAGSVCVFHVGGGVDEVTDPTLPEVPRWEFFIGDRPLAPLLDANQRRRCISQVAAIEDQATAGSVVASIEVVELIQGEWEVLPLPDNVWRVMGPAQPAPQAHLRLSHTSVRTSATSHTPNWRSSDVAVGTNMHLQLLGGSSMLPQMAEPHPAAEAPQATEASEDLAALQTLRMTSSATNGQPGGVASSAGQPSSGLVPGQGHHSLATSLNGSSDRPTNGSGAERLRAAAASQPHPHPHHPLPQVTSLLAGGISHSARFEPSDPPPATRDSMERANSVPAGATSQLLQLQAAVGSGSHTSQAAAAPPPPAAAPSPLPAPPAPVVAGASGAAGSGGSGGAAAAAAAAAAQLPPRLRHEFVNQPEHVQRRIAGLLRMHVLGSVRIRVEAGHLDFINEIRPLTCMFLGFPSLLQPRDDVNHRDQVQCVQLAYTSVQAVMRKWDGSFLQFRSDEKGFVGICAFGLPGHTHEDNPARGIRAALELASTIRAGGHTVAIGVTTGDLLCTCVGARKLRSEYTVFGDAINLSARLMVKSKKDPSMGEILCDEPTYLRAKYQASFVELERLPVKGKAQPVLVYRVGAHDATAEAQAAQQRREAAEVSSGERPLIGRDAEMTLTLNQAASMISGLSHGGIIIIEGNTGMGKTKLLMEIRKSLERINTDTSISSRPAFHMVFGMADTANKSQKLHPWRRVFQELFALDLKLKNLNSLSANSTGAGGVSANGTLSQQQQQQQRKGGAGSAAGGQGGAACPQGRRRGTEDGPGLAVFTALGERLSKVPNYDTEWRHHLAELLDLPLASIPLGSMEAEQAQHAQHAAAQQAVQQGQQAHSQAGSEAGDTPMSLAGGGGGGGASSANGVLGGVSNVAALAMGGEGREMMLTPSLPGSNANSTMRSPAPWRAPSMRHTSMTMAGTPPVGVLDAHGHASTINIGSTAAAAAAGGTADTNAASSPPHGPGHPPHNSQVGAPIRKNSLNFLVHVLQEFISLYGPTLALLENLHDFDTWSWQLLVKAAELIPADCMILATTRPNDLPAVGSSHHLHGKAALYQKVAMMYRHLLKLPAATRIVLEPFSFAQTKSLMQVVSDVSYPEQYVLAVMEKTGGMPLYIEKVTEFLCQSQRPWLPDQGGEFSANVNKMIRNLNFQQVIIERMDRLKPGIHLTLKVASVMGQWVDLDILHKFYPINKSKEELRAHLQELERGNFLKATDAEGVWEFNMVERDIVYEVIPHYQRRRLHAKLAQELEKSLEEQHVATLTTIAYHWNQACMGHEVAEVECSLKAIEFWHRAAEAAYTGSSLMEALKLYQKAAQIAEVLAESMGGSITAAGTHHAMTKGHDRHGDGGPAASLSGREGNGSVDVDGRIDATDQSFTAVGSAFRGQLNWALISRLSRSQWEKSMASCCLGIVLQHRYEFNTQLEYWDTEDYFRLLTEHAIRGLMLLGAPHPKELLSEKGSGAGGAAGAILGLSRACACCFRSGSSVSGSLSGQQHGWHSGLVLQDSEVQEIRDILLVLIIAAEHYSLQHDGGEYTRLLTFCKRVCKYFNKCSDSGTDPFLDIRSACSSRIKNYKASRALQSTLDFGVSQEPALEAAAARNAPVVVGPELSRAVLDWQRQGTLGRGHG